MNCFHLAKNLNPSGRSCVMLLAGMSLLNLTVAAESWVSPALPKIPDRIYNVTNYGAIGDGVATNTAAIQASINAASAAGGGTVEVPAGIFLSGPLQLENHVNLRVDGTLRMLPLGKYPG